MFARLTLAVVLAAVPLAAQQEEKPPKIPKDSVLATIDGCLKGRVVRAYDVRQPDASAGVTIRSRSFRVQGKKDVIADVKKNDGQHVEIVGVIRKSALIEPGIRFKGGRVVIGGGSGAIGAGRPPDPAENVVVIDALSLRPFGNSCSGK